MSLSWTCESLFFLVFLGIDKNKQASERKRKWPNECERGAREQLDLPRIQCQKCGGPHTQTYNKRKGKYNATKRKSVSIDGQIFGHRLWRGSGGDALSL